MTTGLQHNYRFSVFAAQRDYINKHNAEAALGLHTYDLGINEFSDLTHEEFLAYYTAKMAPHQLLKTIKKVDVSDLPETVDWRDKGVVTDVKNQGQCGSCWSFSTTGSIEAAHAQATGELIALSEQQLVDCDRVDHGCSGGLMDNGFDYVMRVGGLVSEESYPYTAMDIAMCKFDKDNIVANISGYQDIEQGSETDLQKAVAEVGPVSVGIDASHRSFQSYHSGVYNPTECSSYMLDHGVLAVGYGQDEGMDYWLVKNSWGPSWGLDGYIKMVRNQDNTCGIATMASYPIV